MPSSFYCYVTWSFSANKSISHVFLIITFYFPHLKRSKFAIKKILSLHFFFLPRVRLKVPKSQQIPTNPTAVGIPTHRPESSPLDPVLPWSHQNLLLPPQTSASLKKICLCFFFIGGIQKRLLFAHVIFFVGGNFFFGKCLCLMRFKKKDRRCGDGYELWLSKSEFIGQLREESPDQTHQTHHQGRARSRSLLSARNLWRWGVQNQKKMMTDYDGITLNVWP